MFRPGTTLKINAVAVLSVTLRSDCPEEQPQDSQNPQKLCLLGATNVQTIIIQTESTPMDRILYDTLLMLVIVGDHFSRSHCNQQSKHVKVVQAPFYWLDTN